MTTDKGDSSQRVEASRPARSMVCSRPMIPLGRILTLWLLLISACGLVIGQTAAYPKEIRGYKVERRVVDSKKDPNRSSSEPDDDSLIRFGDPKLIRATPLGISLEIPMVVSPVRQKGEVDFLLFEDMVVNGTPVDIDEYHHEFELPTKKPLTLHEPLKFYINLPNVVFAAIDEWSNSKAEWLVTGRIYVFGRFNKIMFKFKRCIPVELKMTIRNPLRK